jgi:hypothetical protein
MSRSRNAKRKRLLLRASIWVAAALTIYVPLAWLMWRALATPTSPTAEPVARADTARLPPAVPTQREPEPRKTPPDYTPVVVPPTTAKTPEPTPVVVPPTPPSPPPTAPPATVTRPVVPRHHEHIRIAMLAYHGNPMGPFEDDLLQKHVDLVVPEPIYLQHIRDVAPKTPSLIYTNTSSLYTDLLADWLTYADTAGVSREAAFYHAARPATFRGDSPSSRPVAWFWRVYRGTDALTDLTYLIRAEATSRIAFGARGGEALYLGHPDRFREINFDLATGAGAGWSAALEYPTAVDANGKPTTWAALKSLTDTMAGLTKTGQLTFDPPADWKPASLANSYRLYYVRFRTTTGGSAPAARTILGRDYVGAKGRGEGVIPVFDTAADANGDGYLDDAEYAKRAPGKDARFIHESRLPCANYGQMRPAANPSSPDFRKWAVDYHVRLIGRQPLATGLFMDNSAGKPFVDARDAREPLADYAKDYGAMLADISKAVAPHWILGNTAGGLKNADAVIRQSPAYLEEFAIRPLAHNYLQFEELAETIDRRAKLTSPPPYAVIDSLPARGDPADARTQLSTLAYYYLLADPEATFLMFYGGHEPATTWRKHWAPAAAYDVGQPKEHWSRLTEGNDPSNPAMKYRVYQRTYGTALVLYKPLSHKAGDWKVQSALGDETATIHDLKGTYRPLRADGTLGEPITRVSLRNGEGAILVKSQ